MILLIIYTCDWPGCENKLIAKEIESIRDYYWSYKTNYRVLCTQHSTHTSEELDDAIEFLEETNSIGQL